MKGTGEWEVERVSRRMRSSAEESRREGQGEKERERENKTDRRWRVVSEGRDGTCSPHFPRAAGEALGGGTLSHSTPDHRRQPLIQITGTAASEGEREERRGWVEVGWRVDGSGGSGEAGRQRVSFVRPKHTSIDWACPRVEEVSPSPLSLPVADLILPWWYSLPSSSPSPAVRSRKRPTRAAHVYMCT